MKVTFVSLMGTEYDISVNQSDDICTIKKQLESFFCCDNIRFIKNNKEIVRGTIESNNIFDGDKINFTINMKTGCDIVQQKIDLLALQTMSNCIQLSEMHDKSDIVNDTKKLNNSVLTPIEQLQHLQQTNSITEENYEDLRILFQKCRNQLEDEYNKEQQVKKEIEKTKKKIEDVKKRMAQRKNKKNKKPEKPYSFGGLRKGFLL
jgi:hypothetical protein